MGITAQIMPNYARKEPLNTWELYQLPGSRRGKEGELRVGKAWSRWRELIAVQCEKEMPFIITLIYTGLHYKNQPYYMETRLGP